MHTSAGILAVVMLGLAWSLVYPSVAWAHDCPQELAECLRLSLQSPLGMMAAAMLMGAAAMRWAMDATYRSLPMKST